jgi:serine/threonine protein kinase
MDEIQDCIADAHFGEVLRGRDTSKPNMRMPVPPPTFDRQQWCAERKIDLASVAVQPVGHYILSRYNREGRSVYHFLAELELFRTTDAPDVRAFTSLLSRAQKLPPKYRDLVDDINQRISTQVLPQLKSASSMNLLLEGGGGGNAGNKKERGGLYAGSLQLDDVGPIEKVDENMVDVDEDSDGGESGVQGRPSQAEPAVVKERERDLTVRRLSLNRHRAEHKNTAIELFNRLRDKLLADQQPVWRQFVGSPDFVRLVDVLWYCEQPVDMSSFNTFRDLGRGAFGVVSGARFRATASLLALKCMNKKLVKGKNALKLVKEERAILAKLGEHPSPFTVFLKYSWQDKDTFFLALPLCTGGDLQYQLALDKYCQPERARMHVAEVLQGIAHLHSLGILYRDLKPDNILLDEDGHCRISDMGLAVVSNGKPLRGRAGTPGYWPPEMISKKRYSYPADWWSLGCVMYELLAGRCPFSKLNTKMERDEATMSWPISFPDRLGCGVNGEKAPFPEDAKAILLKLLDRDKTTRLGSSERGAEDIKADPYFRTINWSKLQRRELEMPWKPRREAINAFNQSDIDGKSNEHDYRKLKLEPEDLVEDFNYTSKISHQEDVVEVLKMQDDGHLQHLDKPDSMGCCKLQ